MGLLHYCGIEQVCLYAFLAMVTTATHSLGPIPLRLPGLIFVFRPFSLHLYLHSDYIIFVKVDLLCVLQKLLVLLHPVLCVLALEGVDLSELAQMTVLVGIPLFLGLPAFLFLLFRLDQLLDVGNPFPLVVVGLFDELLLGLLVDVHEQQRVLDEIELDEVVQGRVGHETGSVVDFEHVGVEALVDHDVDAQNVEAHVPVLVVGLGELVLVTDQGLPDYHRLHQHVVQLLLERAQIEPPPLHVLVDRRQGTLVAGREVVYAVVVDILRVLLVDGVVGQVHEKLLQVGFFGWLVLFGGEAGQSLFVDVEPHGVGATQKHVHPKVELESVDQERVGQVLLDYKMTSIFDLCRVEGQENAPPLAVGFWLNYVAFPLCLAPFDLLPELGELAGQQPGPGEEIVVLGILLGHFIKVVAEQVLAGEHVDAGEVADLLVEVHLHEGVGLDH